MTGTETEENMRNAFKEFGLIDNIRVPGKNFGFVAFTTHLAVIACVCVCVCVCFVVCMCVYVCVCVCVCVCVWCHFFMHVSCVYLFGFCLFVFLSNYCAGSYRA